MHKPETSGVFRIFTCRRHQGYVPDNVRVPQYVLRTYVGSGSDAPTSAGVDVCVLKSLKGSLAEALLSTGPQSTQSQVDVL